MKFSSVIIKGIKTRWSFPHFFFFDSNSNSNPISLNFQHLPSKIHPLKPPTSMQTLSIGSIFRQALLHQVRKLI